MKVSAPRHSDYGVPLPLIYTPFGQTVYCDMRVTFMANVCHLNDERVTLQFRAAHYCLK